MYGGGILYVCGGWGCGTDKSNNLFLRESTSIISEMIDLHETKMPRPITCLIFRFLVPIFTATTFNTTIFHGNDIT